MTNTEIQSDADREYRPTVTDIGARLGGRTLTPQGARVGTFNTETYPTARMVDELIDDATNVVTAAIGTELEEAYWPMAKTAVIAYVCLSIEIGYFPETATASDSAYAAFKDRFEKQIGYIENALNQKRPNERRILSLKQETLVGVRGGRLDPFANEMLP